MTIIFKHIIKVFYFPIFSSQLKAQSPIEKTFAAKLPELYYLKTDNN
jgi:hypothetical protein